MSSDNNNIYIDKQIIENISQKENTVLYYSIFFVLPFSVAAKVINNLAFILVSDIYQGLLITICFVLLLVTLFIISRLWRKLEKLNKELNKNKDVLVKGATSSEDMVITEENTINKLGDLSGSESNLLETLNSNNVSLNSVVFLKAEGNGVSVVTDKNKIWLWTRLKDCEDKFPDAFVRVHRSYIVNLAHVEEILSSSVKMSDGKEISIGNTRLQEVQLLFNAYNKD